MICSILLSLTLVVGFCFVLFKNEKVTKNDDDFKRLDENVDQEINIPKTKSEKKSEITKIEQVEVVY